MLTLVCAPLVRALMRFSLASDTFTFIPFIPLLSLFAGMWPHTASHEVQPRKSHTGVAGIAKTGGVLGIVTGVSGYAGLLVLDPGEAFSTHNQLSVATACYVGALVGTYCLLFGFSGIRRQAMAFILLLFVIPIPLNVLNGIVHVLQRASVYGVHALLSLSGISFFREGTVFHMSLLQFDVAPQCSGIRSSLVLWVTSLLLGHMVLRSWVHKSVLFLAVLPITVFKNSVRIALLTLGGAYVNEGFLHGPLHRNGGIVFFVIAFGMLWAVSGALHRWEKKRDAT
jgi:exosortase